ncbi:hypothetical protein DKG77_13495 [Flagellimonas aquimarina]|uniref:Uncharacterized protein n=1 Tax=Flagellimonas aquimarina TaxID=2201895 RepID=A0A316L0U5_9FLAO|nr:hypothetical protein [Allomuricauda koreensis]PWL37783.1 hypothetical protein DKG77_13495 [Allomuricauda koreensis]
MEKKDEFYIGYADTVGQETKSSIRRFVLTALGLLIVGAVLFGSFQKEASNSTFDFDTPTKISGTYYEAPYPMLRVELTENTFKDILLLGFGKFGANAYLDNIKKSEVNINGKHLTIEGNLIYYNGKTLLQIDDSHKIDLDNSKKKNFILPQAMGTQEVVGEIVDPKCYFGVMKPGYGKIHRSCAALCISGGIPPVLVASEANAVSEYFLLTDLKGNPIHKDIIPYIGIPSKLKGEVEKMEDWYIMRIDVSEIEKLEKESSIY